MAAPVSGGAWGTTVEAAALAQAQQQAITVWGSDQLADGTCTPYGSVVHNPPPVPSSASTPSLLHFGVHWVVLHPNAEPAAGAGAGDADHCDMEIEAEQVGFFWMGVEGMSCIVLRVLCCDVLPCLHSMQRANRQWCA